MTNHRATNHDATNEHAHHDEAHDHDSTSHDSTSHVATRDAVLDVDDLVGLYARRDATRRALTQQDLSIAERVVRAGVAEHVITRRLPGLVAELVEAAADDVGARRTTDLESQANADLRVVEAVERCKAVLDAVGLEALARLQGDIESSELLRSADLGPTKPVGWLDAPELTAMEVTTSTGLGDHDVHARLALATSATAPAAELRSRLRSGALSLHRACAIHAETRQLPAEVGLEIIESVLRDKDGAPPSPSLFRQRLTRACLAADREAGRRRREARRRRRGAFALIDPDGLGALHVTNDADKIVAAMERVDAIARAARAGGDTRNLDTLRADVITDILMFGWPSPAEMSVLDDDASAPAGRSHPDSDNHAVGDRQGADRAHGHRGTSGHGDTRRDSQSPRGCDGVIEATEPAVGSAPQARNGRGRLDRPPVLEEWFTRLGQHPPAQARIVVPFTTAAGVTDAPCEIPGHGWVLAEHAREIMLNDGSTWHRLAVDADTGAALHLETASYRPTAAMRAHVEAVDGTCRAPGCTVPAARCDLDHDIPWPHGPTDVANLTSKHRRHHNAHTHGHWAVTRDDVGVVRWRTKAGRTYETRPKDWLDGVRELGDAIEIERAQGADRAQEVRASRRVEGSEKKSVTKARVPVPLDDPPPF